MIAPLIGLLTVTVEAELAVKFPANVTAAFTVTVPVPDVFKINAPVPVLVTPALTRILASATAVIVRLLLELSAFTPVAAPSMVMFPASAAAIAVLIVTAEDAKLAAMVAQLRLAGLGVAGVTKAGPVNPAVSDELLILRFVGSRRSIPVCPFGARVLTEPM